mgnify:FL=1
MGFFQDPFGTIGRTVSQSANFVVNTTENTTKKAAEFFVKPQVTILSAQAKGAGEILKSAKESGITGSDAVNLGRLAAGDPTAALGLLGNGLEAQGGAPSDMVKQSQPIVYSQPAQQSSVSPILIIGGIAVVGGIIFLMRRK